jgi:DNA-binding NtrC family response regulator
VTVNCAAIPETMLESLLFGHVRGAFTGATTHKVGELQKAHGGTLFLDELGELPLGLQAKVLRAVELGEVLPLGSNAGPERVDVRMICATHRDLGAMVRGGKFRDDLYYRLAVVRIAVPPLRTYKDNIEVMAHVLRAQACERNGRRVTRISPEALALLGAYDFPGNVRELRNAMEYAVVMAPGDEITAADLPDSISAKSVPTPAPSPARRPTLRQMREAWLGPLEAAYLRDLLGQTAGNVRRAAKLAGVDPVTLYRLLSKRGVSVVRQ